MQSLMHKPSQGSKVATYPLEILTPRQCEILVLVARGMSDRDIAQKLFIATSTVENHMHNLLQRLGVKNRTEAALLALCSGMIDTEELDALLHNRMEEIT